MESTKIVFWILEDKKVHSMETLISKTRYSERKVRSIISEIRKEEKQYGFKLVTIKNQGYCIQVFEESRFKEYEAIMSRESELDVLNRELRVSMILYYLLHTKEFTTLQTISKLLDVSSKTISNDVSYVREILQEYDLTLYTKAHYGMRIEGDERNIRKLFSRVTNDIHQYNHSNTMSDSLLSLQKDENIKRVLIETFSNNNILMTAAAIESILLHLWILLYRVKENNYVTDINVNAEIIDTRYYTAAKEVIEYLEQEYDMEVSKPEVDLLASQFFGKSILEDTPQYTKTKMTDIIQHTLEKIDVEYETEYSKDAQLIDGLLLHIYPLIMRLSFGLELSNSLIHILPAQYTSAFLIAMRFTEYHPDLESYSLSRDEIGYLALHFANYQERINLHRMQSIKSIVIVYENMRSDSSLLRTKIQIVFPNAKIKAIPFTNIGKYNLDDIELLLSTSKDIVLMKHSFVVNEPYDDREMNRIKNAVLFNYDNVVHKSIQIKDLFFKSLYFHESGKNYYQIIEKYALILEKQKYAKEGFAASVLEREKRMNTIYQNGVAGPHSIVPYANTDCIVIILLEDPIYHDDKKINCIFLINIRSGHMMLHQSVSQFIVQLMESEEQIKSVLRTESFERFIEIMKW